VQTDPPSSRRSKGSRQFAHSAGATLARTRSAFSSVAESAAYAIRSCTFILHSIDVSREN
jgi:hypothetical protein